MKLNELKPAEYNPRTITDEQLQRLKKSLQEFGDLSGIVFNRRTGNLVGGHQGLFLLPIGWLYGAVCLVVWLTKTIKRRIYAGTNHRKKFEV